jgi:hypothetical protein
MDSNSCVPGVLVVEVEFKQAIGWLPKYELKSKKRIANYRIWQQQTSNGKI